MSDEEVIRLEALALAADESNRDRSIPGLAARAAAILGWSRAANPAAILTLIRRLREEEADARRFRWVADKMAVPYFGGFQLHFENEDTDIRAAIDDAMKGKP